MINPTTTDNYLEMYIPDEGLGCIRVLLDELKKRIEDTLPSGQGALKERQAKVRALRYIRLAKAECYLGPDGPY